ncbi:GNAT family N-acetyltransferase [Streptomyces mobaraensis]|uniref:GNAT family N-acetyltransferase n=1 Tax=Streptomyces mobaraensis TaxID=35621 RepID=A0A5N5W8E8_STRMB|nr:GNAT family protein [Streptomyces mobaraensis]KAB7845530.1 GNAT family N-acetyltransferase [Streptomyces mobaraensis]
MYPVSRRGQRLELRELTIDDVDAVLAIYGDSEATEHLSFTPRSRQDVGHIVARSIASATTVPRTEFALAVVERESSNLIGYGRLATDPHQPRASTVGFALRPDAWGVGYGVETIHLLLALAFEDLSLHRVWGARSPLNTASARAMQRAGMIEEGRIRQHVFKAGQWRDSIVHAILADEWAGRVHA